MEQRILELLNEIYPLDFVQIESVTEQMYRCTTEQEEFYARITNYKTYDEQLEEVTFTNFLYKEGFGVPPVISSLNGNLIEQMNLEGEVLTVLYRAAPGIHLPRNQWKPNVLKELGRQIGKLHCLSRKFEELETVKYRKDWYENEEYHFLTFIPKEETTIRQVAHGVLSTISELPKNHSTYGLLHGDLWLENILIDRDSNVTMIDFQDCERHYYLYDLAIPIYSALEYTFVGDGNLINYERSITKAIIDGYQEENNLSSDMLEKLPLFIKLKELFEYNSMHMNWDKENLTEEQIRIMNLYRSKIERDSINFKL
ncbi:phosphotransferase [Lederbergia sp. NSJ-179]|uniref:phosphotransferase enzyme family protein n=1 Tax=Lederbergia sp. NSJ-179 TaxID=2931402 RepID=UPI001FD057A7|nr:phosphotransferase [Lederbergia sp. NSJ-179]MCJ7842517.1 phosphotransferase [Lederbergia sp. NSJ-179]